MNIWREKLNQIEQLLSAEKNRENEETNLLKKNFYDVLFLHFLFINLNAYSIRSLYIRRATTLCSTLFSCSIFHRNRAVSAKK